MPAQSPIERDNVALMAKIESAYGTDPTPAAGTDDILCGNFQYNDLYGGNSTQRNLHRGYEGIFKESNTGPFVSFTFDVELAGAGTDVNTTPAYGVLLQCCALGTGSDETTSYDFNLVSGSYPSCTFYIQIDGQRQIVTGCRGNIEYILEHGAYPLMRFTFMGLYAKPTASAMPGSRDYSAFQTPEVFSNNNTTVFTLGAYSPKVQSFNFSPNNQLVFEQYVGGSNEVKIAGRNPTGSIVVEAPAIGTHDFFDDVESHSNTINTFELTIQHGDTANNIVELYAPVLQLGPNISESRAEGGGMLYEMGCRAIPSSGNDEWRHRTK